MLAVLVLISAFLSQTDKDGQERVIAYGSRALTKPERRYCVTRKELLAVVTFIQLYRPYLTCQKFILHTDHGFLTWLRNFKEPEGQLARCLERLQELDFDIIHRKGKAHTNADALSRFPCQQCGRERHTPPATLDVATTSLLQPLGKSVREEDFRSKQMADPAIGSLLRGKEAGIKPSLECMGGVSRSSRRLLQIWEQLIVCDGILCCRFEATDGSSHAFQIVVPTALREEVLFGLHEGPLGGHFLR